MSRIFLSHSSNDGSSAVAVRDWLGEEGWEDVFLDLDAAQGIHPGERWERALYEHASRSEAVIFLVSRDWLNSEWCRREHELARKLNKRTFVVLIEAIPIGELPSYLTETHQAVSLAVGQDHRVFRVVIPGAHEERHVTFSREGLARLKTGLTQAGLDPRFFSWPPEGEPDRSPFRGLEAMEAVDAGVFFGREGPIIEAIDALRGLREAAPPRLFAILGASGAGKSSFLRAGLTPRLARDDRNFLCLPVVRPERAGVTGSNGLVAALAAACAKNGVETTRARIREAAAKGASALRPILASLAQRAQRATGAARPPTLLIAVDQAEEIFAAEGAPEGEALLVLLRDLAVADDPAIIVLFAIRSDSYDLLERAKPLEGLPQRPFSLLPMPRGAYQTVVEGPARRLAQAGKPFEIDPALTQALLQDVETSGGDSLPLLAFTLEQLYRDHFNGRRLTRTDYEDFGRLTGAIEAAMAQAFAAADADPRIPKDLDARRALLRRGLIPWLAGVDPETKTPRRRVARAGQIPQEARPLIDLLVAQRLLTRDVDKDSGETTIEPAHEALLRQWGLLQGWLEEDFGRLTTLEGIKRAAREWDANAKAGGWLAHQGERLAEAHALDARPDIAAKLEPTDRAYLAACRDKERAARVRARRVQAVIYVLLVGVIVGLVGWINQDAIKREVNWQLVMRPYMLAEIRPYILSGETAAALKPGATFRECATACPEMIVVPAGAFAMGSPTSEPGRESDEGPQHEVAIAAPFAVSKYDVTFDDWDACVAVGGCPHTRDPGMERGRRPIVNVTWEDAQSYVAWFSRMTGAPYRLLSEAEWEYATRAGTTTRYYWGDEAGERKADCRGCGSPWDSKESSPVGSFAPNGFGLFDMAGDVWQWVEDCYHPDYNGAPTDGSAWTSGDCRARVTRGGSWHDHAPYMRSATRIRDIFNDSDSDVGFRIARSLAR